MAIKLRRASLWVLAVALAWPRLAHADCTVNSVTSVSPSIHNVGTYGSGTARPANSTRTLTITVQATGINNTSTGTNCDVRINLRRASSPAALSTSGGPVTLPYSASISGDAMIFGATAVPSNPTGPGNPTGTLNGTLVLGSPRPMTINAVLAVTPVTPAATPTVGSGYTDDLFLDIYNWPNAQNAPNRRVLVGSLPLSLAATVTQSCSITGAANTSQTISVGPTGLTTGMGGIAPSFNVSCTGRSNVSLTSQNGAVTQGNVNKSLLPTVANFRNRIDYSASILGKAGTDLNTSSFSAGPATAGPFTFSNAVISNSATTVSIVPQTSTVPLVAGSYNDTLTISIVPQ